MKRILSVILMLTLTVSLLAGCGEKKSKPVEGGMKIATTTGDFGAYADSHEDQIELLYESGFRYIDLSFYNQKNMDPYLKDDWKENAESLKKFAEKKGMSFVQAHSFGGNAFKDEATYDKIVKYTIRSIEVCAILGIPQIVVHAPYESHLTKDEFFEKALDFYKEFFPIMEQTGVKVLLENSAQKVIGADNYFYSGKTIREFIEYATNPLLGACWDTGHANIQGDQYDGIMDLGDLLWGIHVADNFGEKDEHLMPYVGTTAIDEAMTALKSIHYSGAFTFEAENTLLHSTSWLHSREAFKNSLKAYVPSVELKVEMEKVLYSIGQYILTQYEIPIG